jgi:hypothetical protein
MTIIWTTEAAKALLKFNGFKVVVNEDIESAWEELSIIVEGRSFVVFTTENTDHGFTSADKSFLTVSEILDVATRFKIQRTAESLAAKENDENEF